MRLLLHGDPRRSAARRARHWAVVPEEHKVSIRAVITARFQGHSPQEAIAIARAQVKRWQEMMATPDERFSATASAPDAPAQATAPAHARTSPQPRLRSLWRRRRVRNPRRT